MSAEILRCKRERKAKVRKQKKRGRRLVRLKEAMARLGVKHSKFYDDFIKPGRLTLIELGVKARAVDEDELDEVIASLPRAEIRPVVPRRKREEARR
jgi:predicted DNA-binding transcriptional regulator AlpA